MSMIFHVMNQRRKEKEGEQNNSQQRAEVSFQVFYFLIHPELYAKTIADTRFSFCKNSAFWVQGEYFFKMTIFFV